MACEPAFDVGQQIRVLASVDFVRHPERSPVRSVEAFASAAT
jgi:hypothetical protein